MKPKSAEKSDHVPHELLSRETREYQPCSDRGREEGNKFGISCALLFLRGGRVAEFEVLKILKEPDEIQNLSTGTRGFFEGEGLMRSAQSTVECSS